MSASTKQRNAAALCLVLISGLTFAGIGQSGAKAVSASDPGVAATSAATGTQMRCWQEGRLLFDARWLKAAPKIDSATLVMTGHSEAGPVQLLDLKSATCLIQPELAGTAPAGE